MAVEMELLGVRVELPANQPVLMLRETVGDHRVVPIYIGAPEAQAIQFGLDGVTVPRPLTHDLIGLLLGALDTKVEHVVITRLEENTFYADLVLNRGGERHVISARPSDAVAVAVRVGAPIFAAEAIVDEVGLVPEADDDDDVEPEIVVEQFREFIDSVNPEDFGS